MDYVNTILIVDDEPAGRETLEALLLSQGYNLVLASNGMEALEKAAHHPPDLILLDVMMPGMDGYEVCQRLRTDHVLAEVPIIMVTALDDRDSRLRGIDAGADDFVSKPFDRAELRSRVRSITRLNRYRRLLNERAKFERVVELSPDGILIVDALGTIRLANPAMLRILGATNRSAVEGQSVFAFIASGQLAKDSDFLERIFADAASVTRTETVFTRLDGASLPVEINAGHHAWEGTPAVQIVVRDITERKQAEEHIQRQIRRLTALRIVDMAITASMDRRVTLDVLLDQITTQLQVHAASVLLLNPHTQMLEYAAGRGFKSPDIKHLGLRLGEDYPGRAILERRTIHTSDLPASPPSFARTQLLIGEGFKEYYVVPLIAKGQVKGILELLHREPVTPDLEWREFLEALAAQAAIAIDNAELFDGLQRANIDLAVAYDATLEGWVHALDLRDDETEGHTQRVCEITLRLARAMGISEAELVHVRRGALLHDIGKMGIPDSILLKPGPLTAEEWDVMRRHPVYAYEWLAPITFLRPALDIPYCHHERWDGSGYPRGLRGTQIPLAARIFAVVDVWDALRSDRPYRSGWPEDTVREYIRSKAGTHFDPQVVEEFLKLDTYTVAGYLMEQAR